MANWLLKTLNWVEKLFAGFQRSQKDGVITNDNRITAALPTIKYILEQGGRNPLLSPWRVKEEAAKEGKSLAL